MQLGFENSVYMIRVSFLELYEYRMPEGQTHAIKHLSHPVHALSEWKGGLRVCSHDQLVIFDKVVLFDSSQCLHRTTGTPVLKVENSLYRLLVGVKGLMFLLVCMSC